MSAEMVITVVAGFPRCGSTLMMRMLHAGGMEVFAENLTSFETDRIFDLPADAGWLERCRGKVVKILDPHRSRPSFRHDYQTIWMDRVPVEQARSQVKLLKRWGGFATTRQELLAIKASLIADRPRALRVIRGLGPVLIVSFENLLADPLREVERVRDFLGRQLDCTKMVVQVVPRSPRCLPYMLEERQFAASAPTPGAPPSPTEEHR